ncbi:MAG: PQQ-dependent sugar dehydrogenase [Rhodospirillaceae bacterium]|nr:PQQ-dependent sugar dehydrogenase [Rhodospirillaceae bacterium]
MRRVLSIAFIGYLFTLSAPAMAQPHGVGEGGFINLREMNIQKPPDIVAGLYQQECAVCHGEALQGAAQGSALVGADLVFGSSIEDIAKNTRDGFPDRGMPAWSTVLNDDQVLALAIYISEQRQGTNLDDFRYNAPLIVPNRVIKSEHHDFTLKTVVKDLDALPFSIQPLSNGLILLTEKTKGLSIITREGKQQPLIRDTPKAYDDSFDMVGQPMGLGWLMDVALHPDYDLNGLIYLHYGDRCGDCNATSRASGQDVSMNKLVRGRIRDGFWIEEQTIWEADKETYTLMPEIAAGGRITFDDGGYVYFSVGMKGPLEHIGVQDLTLPYGKIMRLHDDGRVPKDNPFVDDPAAVQAIWSYGHRNPQGLEFNTDRGQLWSTEMGPRGGDELNLIQMGLNYGWPLTSKGVNYDGTPVAWGEVLGIDFYVDDMEPPVIDFTPAPAISSFAFYDGAYFPAWNGSIIVGTLRASDLMRIELEDGKEAYRETLIEDLARIRDVEIGPGGEVYILVEHDTGGRIVKLVRVIS